MTMYYVDGKRYDWRLSDSQKRAVTWTLGALSTLAWLLYSTPATINVGVEITKNVSILGMLGTGYFLGITGALIVSIAEYAFMMLSVWKSWWYLLPTLLCGIISIMGTVLFLEIGEQDAQIKRNEISAISKSIQAKEIESIQVNNRIAAYQHKINNPEFGKKVPTWTYTRLRQAEEKLSVINDSLATMRSKKSDIEKKYGAIVTISGNSTGDKAGSIGFAIFIEMVVIGCGILAIGIKQSETGKQFVVTENGKLVTIQVDNDENQIVNQHKNLTGNVNQCQNLVDKNRHYGYQTSSEPVDKKNDNVRQPVTKKADNVVKKTDNQVDNQNCKPVDNRTRKKLIDIVNQNGGKSDPVILHFFDNGETNRAEIGRLVGSVLPYQVSRQYVTKVLKREGRVQ